MIQEDRWRRILEQVWRDGKVTVAEICEQFGVSEMTARRDLRELDRRGLLRRVHGGGITMLGRSYEPPYQLRASKAVEAKKAIGRAAAEMVRDGDSIALDVGTTTLSIARALHNRRSLTILTASIPIANEIIAKFSLSQDIRLILTGGIVRPGEFSMIGNLAERAYRELHVDKAFLGVGGLNDQDGLTEYNLEDAEVKRCLLNSASQKIVVADSSKLGRTVFAEIGTLAAIDTVVTDEGASLELVAALRQRGIEVVIAGQTRQQDEKQRRR